MGTISERRRKDGSKAYTAQIRIKRDGKTIYTEAQTFDRKSAASAWMKQKEVILSQPGALEKSGTESVTLGEAIGKYLEESRKSIGRTKEQALEVLTKHPIASMACSEIAAAEVSSLISDLAKGWTPEGEVSTRKAQTVGNYISHLGAVFAVAKPMWNYPLDHQSFKDAVLVNKRMGLVSKSESRERRPTLLELDKLLSYFEERSRRVHNAMPMHKIILFAVFSTRREAEITRITWDDFDRDEKRILVRDMKNPGQKIGNDIWCDLPPEAIAVMDEMNEGDRIFPFNSLTISSNFTRACALLGIEDLTFHDLRHEGVSRLFELGWTIPHVASVSGHRSWSSLKRYAHIRQKGDKYKGWKWNPLRTSDDTNEKNPPAEAEG